ncbi:hypothetical protein EKO23_16310 [Nocardioides guangzhouensis]|uniref:Uncharacterized protein n=1 Tax=Nocardioides guangzhouensis TaxID=2497878 RepID=A0A4Q4Z8T0_9ACTN|nr:hypothetical protein [Nocardioides guangzhouensis]RYP84223.1 hypothetical protein EKO23_16310 [Nocardioides guangzhouensis]
MAGTKEGAVKGGAARRARTRAHIVRNVIDLLSENPRARVTQDRLCESAGFAPSTLTRAAIKLGPLRADLVEATRLQARNRSGWPRDGELGYASMTAGPALPFWDLGPDSQDPAWPWAPARLALAVAELEDSPPATLLPDRSDDDRFFLVLQLRILALQRALVCVAPQTLATEPGPAAVAHHALATVCATLTRLDTDDLDDEGLMPWAWTATEWSGYLYELTGGPLGPPRIPWLEWMGDQESAYTWGRVRARLSRGDPANLWWDDLVRFVAQPNSTLAGAELRPAPALLSAVEDLMCASWSAAAGGEGERAAELVGRARSLVSAAQVTLDQVEFVLPAGMLAILTAWSQGGRDEMLDAAADYFRRGLASRWGLPAFDLVLALLWETFAEVGTGGTGGTSPEHVRGLRSLILQTIRSRIGLDRPESGQVLIFLRAAALQKRLEQIAADGGLLAGSTGVGGLEYLQCLAVQDLRAMAVAVALAGDVEIPAQLVQAADALTQALRRQYADREDEDAVVEPG